MHHNSPPSTQQDLSIHGAHEINDSDRVPHDVRTQDLYEHYRIL